MRALLAIYALAMGGAAFLIKPCPCCGPIFKYSRAGAAICWIGIAAWAALSKRWRFELYLAAFLLSLVQIVNHWLQFVRFRDTDPGRAAWIVPSAVIGAGVCAVAMLLQRRRAPRTA